MVNYDILIELIKNYLKSNSLYRFSTDTFHYIFHYKKHVYICKVNNHPDNDDFHVQINIDDNHDVIEFLDKHENFTQDDIDILCLNLL